MSDGEKRKKTDENYIKYVEKRTGQRIYHEDGYVNMMNKYGTDKDTIEHYYFEKEPTVPDSYLSEVYEGNGLFARIIDAPAEEATRCGFELDGVKDTKITDYVTEMLDELDWEEAAQTAIKWQRLFGGAMIVMLIDDGRGIDEPVDWEHVKSIEDLKVYDRSVIQPDYGSMFQYDGKDPFKIRGGMLGTPEFYHVYSKYGSFTVHESRCLVFRNGALPEKCTNFIYELWGMPEYVRIRRELRNAEIAHEDGPKMLDKSVQAVYKMKNLADELATEGGEDRVVKRLEAIDLARGLCGTIAIDGEGEEYDFRTFSYTGVAEIINVTCNMLSAITNIPQTVLFGRSPAGMDATGNSDLENWYSFIERIQKKSLKANTRYLVTLLLQGAVNCGDIEEMPKVSIKFKPLWSLSDTEQAQLDQVRASTQQVRASTAAAYVQMGVLDPTEVRKGLHDEEDFDVETTLDEIPDDEIFDNMPQQGQQGGMPGMPGMPGAGDGGEGGMPQMPGMPAAGGQEEPKQPQETAEKAPEEAGHGKKAKSKENTHAKEKAQEDAPGVSDNAAKTEDTDNTDAEETEEDATESAIKELASEYAEKVEGAKSVDAEIEKLAKEFPEAADGNPEDGSVKKTLEELANQYSLNGRIKELRDEYVKQIEAVTAKGNRTPRSVRQSETYDKTAVEGGEAQCAARSCAVIIVKDGRVLAGERTRGDGIGLICGPGGHIREDESAEQAATRETEEEFGIVPGQMIKIGEGPKELGSNLYPVIFLCTEYEGDIDCGNSGEISNPRFYTLNELEAQETSVFTPFKDAIKIMTKELRRDSADSGTGSDNLYRKGNPKTKGQINAERQEALLEEFGAELAIIEDELNEVQESGVPAEKKNTALREAAAKIFGIEKTDMDAEGKRDADKIIDETLSRIEEDNIKEIREEADNGYADFPKDDERSIRFDKESVTPERVNSARRVTDNLEALCRRMYSEITDADKKVLQEYEEDSSQFDIPENVTALTYSERMVREQNIDKLTEIVNGGKIQRDVKVFKSFATVDAAEKFFGFDELTERAIKGAIRGKREFYDKDFMNCIATKQGIYMKGCPVISEVFVPEGAKGVFLGTDVCGELLLQRGTSLRIMGCKKTAKTWRIAVAVMGQEPVKLAAIM